MEDNIFVITAELSNIVAISSFARPNALPSWVIIAWPLVLVLGIIFVNRDKFINWINIVKEMWCYVLAWWTSDRCISITFLSLIPLIDIQIPAHCHPSTFKSQHIATHRHYKFKHIATHRHHILAVCIGCLSHEPRALSIRGDEGRKLGRQGRVGIYENGNRTTHLLNARNLLQTAVTVVFFFFFGLQQVV